MEVAGPLGTPLGDPIDALLFKMDILKCGRLNDPGLESHLQPSHLSSLAGRRDTSESLDWHSMD